jgi:pSer/pThr/pTyr-binding forkhead associated (FHA) protein
MNEEKKVKGGMFKAELKFQNFTLKEYIFPEKTTVTVGRHFENDIVLRDDTVSRHHASFIRDESGFIVTDKGSKNGIIVNAINVESARLEDGDVVRIGDNLVMIVYVSSIDEGSLTITGEHTRLIPSGEQ